jgi:hypothetical protein
MVNWEGVNIQPRNFERLLEPRELNSLKRTAAASVCAFVSAQRRNRESDSPADG